jgi:NTP pyrophosphatase (non-canonical NTP hydrolase)
MNLTEYQQRALKLAAFPSDKALDYLSLGLCGEVAEMLEKFLEEDSTKEDQMKELGGVLWYAAVLADHFGTVLKANYSDVYEGDPVDFMVVHAGLIANKAKKVIRDGTPIDPVFVAHHLDRLLCYATQWAEAHEYHLSQVAKDNIAILESRMARGTISGSGDNR